MSVTDKTNDVPKISYIPLNPNTCEHIAEIPLYYTSFEIIMTPNTNKTFIGNTVTLSPTQFTKTVTAEVGNTTTHYFTVNRLSPSDNSTGMENIRYDINSGYRVFNINSREISKPEPGNVNIFKYEDGRVEKVYVRQENK